MVDKWTSIVNSSELVNILISVRRDRPGSSLTTGMIRGSVLVGSDYDVRLQGDL
jgi:hypothetical protein